MDLKSTQLKDTYGNLLTIGESAGSPTTGTLENGDGEDITILTVAGKLVSTALQPSFDASFYTVDGTISSYSASNYMYVNGLGGASGQGLRLNSNGSATNFIALENSNNSITLNTNSNPAITINSSQQVGIGVSPSAKLHVNDTTYPTLRLSTATSYSNIYHDGTTGSITYSADDGGAIASSSHQFYVDGASAMYLDGTGLGIGTTSPGHPLTVTANPGSADTPVAWIHNSGNATSYDGTVISTVNDGSDVEVLHVRTNNTTYANGTSLMLVRGDGHVGIGTDSPTSILHAKDASAFLTIENTTAGSSASPNYSGILFVQSNGTSTGASIQSGDQLDSNSNNDLIFTTRATGGGGHTEKVRILGGGGITFNGDTASANALDDYEEGTHQATVTCTDSGTITLDSGMDLLSYTKIGRLMTVTGQLQVSSVSSPTGRFNVSLPTSIADLSERAGRSSGSIFVSNTSTNADNFFINGIEGQNSFTVYKGGSTNGTDDSADTFSGDEFITLNFSYVSA